MASLKDLTVPLIDKLAKECNISFKKGEKKADKIAIIESSNIDKTQLDFLLQKYLAIKKTKKKTKKDTISELKGRIRLLEEKVKFLMSKINISEVEVGTRNDRDVITITSDFSDIKKFIKSLILPGESITIDELIEIKEIQKIPFITLKHAIYDLIDENILETSEGNSRQKLFGKIAILKRI